MELRFPAGQLPGRGHRGCAFTPLRWLPDLRKDDGYVYRLDAAGRLIWEFAGDDPFDPAAPLDDNEQFIASPVLSADDAIYAASIWADVYRQGKPWWEKLYAIDAASGRRRWVFDFSRFIGEEQSIWSSPALV